MMADHEVAYGHVFSDEVVDLAKFMHLEWCGGTWAGLIPSVRVRWCELAKATLTRLQLKEGSASPPVPLGFGL